MLHEPILFWAKTDHTGRPALTVRDHCLNVGSVASVLSKSLTPYVRSLLPDGGVTLIAAHDIGKISPVFQLKSRIWKEDWQDRLGLVAPDTYEENHAVVSQCFLSLKYSKPPNWVIAVGGHHGMYPRNRAQLRGAKEKKAAQWMSDAKEELLQELVETFGELPKEPHNVPPKGARLHWFTGFMIFSDWIGSSTEWFPLADPSVEADTVTPEHSLTLAEAAIGAIGWRQRSVHIGLHFSDLFKTDGQPTFSPRPLQQALLDAVDAPGLYIIEAPMGSGKTEAALAGAYKRWCNGGEAGLYFGLPTQLTSNRIHERIKAFLSNTLSESSSLALVHSNAWLSEKRISPIAPTSPDTASQDEANEWNRWFSDNRKSLLAPFGTGTIDQALMATMPVRFSALRLFALSGKVIVIDEVHSYDPYTSALVDQTVEWLLECGCSVFVLSATLTAARRASLVNAAGAKELKSRGAYPLITKVSRGAPFAESIHISDEMRPRSTIQIEHVSQNVEQWIDQAVSAAAAGACVLIVRNTIALAQETFRQLKSQCHEGVECGLIHSRFPQFRRDANEAEWMQKLGKGDAHRPSGAILVGTQVVEQSVDIDADLLITDLAPTDLILQRIGRLHRHTRHRPKGYEPPTCVILQPDVDWNASIKEIKAALGPSAYVYPPFALFQAQQEWGRRKHVVLPSQIRDLLEASASAPDTLPTGAEALKKEQDKKVNDMCSHAKTERPFYLKGNIDDDEIMGTRWDSQRTASIVLLADIPKETSEGVTVTFLNGEPCQFPHGLFHFALARQLNLNAVRVPHYLVAKEIARVVPSWLRQHLPQAILYYCSNDSTRCSPVFGSDHAAYSLCYHPEIGLSYEGIDTGAMDTDTEEAS